MTLTSNPTAPDSHRGNALSDQPPQVRETMLAQLRGGTPPQWSPTTAQAPAASRSTPTDARGFDPALLGALASLIETVAGLVIHRTGSARSIDRGEMKREYVFGPGHVEYFPTWSFWGRTFVHMKNSGSVPTVVTINEDRIQLEPGQETVKDGLWAAFPIRVVNTNESVGSQVTVRVW